MANAEYASRRGGALAQFASRFLKPLAWLLKTGNPAATVDRLFESRHVRDLQLIIGMAVIIVEFSAVVGIVFAIYVEVPKSALDFAGVRIQPLNPKADLYLVGNVLQSFLNLLLFSLDHGLSIWGNFLKYFAPIFAGACIVIGWAYQVGSARLGVVDLFACEISTLCRVATVLDSVRRYVERYNLGPPHRPAPGGRDRPPARPFSSQENYFPVFEGGAKDLQTLEARVVVNITAFYTYMKAVRDTLRSLADLEARMTGAGSGSRETASSEAWRESLCNVVYMLFLALESGRHAIEDLVEFYPERAERTIVILISELEAYGFLLKRYPEKDDTRHLRLMMRGREYDEVVGKLMQDVRQGLEEEHEPQVERRALSRVGRWEPASLMLKRLQARYDAAVDVERWAAAPQETSSHKPRRSQEPRSRSATPGRSAKRSIRASKSSARSGSSE
jgi:hypothetical protein